MLTINLRSTAFRQFLRYLCVGVINTLITLIVIYVCKSFLDINQWVSNAIGYVAGLINSFVWNKMWVFHSQRHPMAEIAKFGIGFLICYGVQFFVTWFLVTPMQLGDIMWVVGGFVFSGYGLSTLFGMGVYTVANFVYNRLVTFA